MKVLQVFADEVRHRESQQTHSFNLSHGQLYVLRELRILYDTTEVEETKSQVSVLERAFRGGLTGALKRELALLRKNGISGEALYNSLLRLYDQHGLGDVAKRVVLAAEDVVIPRVVCSEG